MKNSILALLLLLTSISSYAQDISGSWYGIAKIGGTELVMVMNINKTVDGYSATMDSPDQGAKGIPVSNTSFKDSVLKISITNIKLEYEGKLNKLTHFIGNVKQGSMTFPLVLTREKIERLRPQEPIQPYPYYSEELTFENKNAGITLAGTLTLPKKEGKFPAVILISGSGPQNRDSEILGHKPFLVISDYLTKNGIAVLRFDDRGTGKSKGNFYKATSVDFASDVESAVNYLLSRDEIIKSKIGLIGHSEGGIIAPMVAVNSKDINFIILLAGTGISGDKLLLLQQVLMGRAMGASEDNLQRNKKFFEGAFQLITKSVDKDTLKKELKVYAKKMAMESPSKGTEKPSGMTDEQINNMNLSSLLTPWMQYFLKYDPSKVLEKVKCPVLAIDGSKDLQVPPKENLIAIKNALAKGGNKHITIQEIPNLNHLFQECQTGSLSEYGTIEQTFSPIALTVILDWLKIQKK